MISCTQRRPLAVTAFFAAILSVVILDTANNSAAADGLFEPATAAEMRAAPPSGGTMRDGLRGASDGSLRNRLVSLNTSELARIVPTGADKASNRLERARTLSRAVTLDLFPGVRVTAERKDIEAPEEGGFVWAGEGSGNGVAFVTLVINNNEVLGHIQTGGKLYSIEPVAGRLHRIIEIDQSKIRDDLHTPRLPGMDQKGEATEPSPEAAPKAKTTIKVLVAHTATARAEVGTANQMQARINLAISLANQAFTRSGVLITFLRVGGTTEVNYNEASFYGGLNSGNNYLGVLCDLSAINCAGNGVANNHSGSFAAVRTKRNTYKADLVALMRKQGSACGIAWEPNLNGTVVTGNNIYGFSVTTSTKSYNCVEGNTLAHETGHNMGMNHDRYQHTLDYGVPTPPASQYNFGHVNTAVGKKFFTIMSYQSSCSGCTRIPYFSTPLRNYNGAPVGRPQGTAGKYGAADAVKRLNINRTVIGGYRN